MPSVPTVTGFLLLGFSVVRELQLVHAALFLLVYLAVPMVNLLIVVVTTPDGRLHIPMYFFLRNLSLIELCLISVTLPKSVTISLTNDSSIPFLDYVAQLLLVILFAASEYFVLTAMSYDRYAAIGCPLHYEVIKDQGACEKMAAASCHSRGLFGVLFSASTFSLSFCRSSIVQQSFCDASSLLKITCSEDHVAIDVSVTVGIALGVGCFFSIVVSYTRIFWAVLRMLAAEGRDKAFFTCLAHLAIVIIVILTAVTAHLKPPTDSSWMPNLLVSVLYAVVPPALNPFIYSPRS
ncbi:olfactory receptor 14A2-like [Tachyglossus aculeatus]|uniref:olfactory receptor 14A2-like n=1 Tax=Tachyglossus aculeatus TaxID=9261 RepID=UPI0018F65A09|nr:olfactory receptor 14A2-like [Tachyglossus aculeatus]